MRRQAMADLYDRAARLAATIDGRKAELFRAACSLGKYAAAGVLNEAEITAELLAAWSRSGALQMHGEPYGRQQIVAGLKIAARDPLPILARRFRGIETPGMSA